jgi:hypothetical protein
MRIIVIVLLLLGVQFVLTAFAPAGAGKAWFLWPFASDSKSWLGLVGGLPKQSGSAITPILAGLAGLGFLTGVLALLGWFVPVNWFGPLVLVSSIASAILFILYNGVWAIAPLVLDLVLLWGVLLQKWTVSSF